MARVTTQPRTPALTHPRTRALAAPHPAQAKTKELKSSFNEQFSAVHELCLMVLNASQKPDLIRATLSTLHAFLSWVPLGYIFESNVTEVGGCGVCAPGLRACAAGVAADRRAEIGA